MRYCCQKQIRQKVKRQRTEGQETRNAMVSPTWMVSKLQGVEQKAVECSPDEF